MNIDLVRKKMRESRDILEELASNLEYSDDIQDVRYAIECLKDAYTELGRNAETKKRVE